jgi:phosphohistidine swiveling domain-containing protein
MQKWEKVVERESDFWKNSAMIATLSLTGELFGVEIPSWLTTRRGMKFTHWIDRQALSQCDIVIESLTTNNVKFVQKIEDNFYGAKAALSNFCEILSATDVTFLDDKELLDAYQRFTLLYQALYPAFHLAFCVESLSERKDSSTQELINTLTKVRLEARQEFEKAHESSHKLFNEIAKRNKMTIEDVKWLTIDEVANLLQNKVLPTKKEIEERKFATVLLFENRKYRIFSGNEAVRFIQKETQEDEYRELDILKGTVVFPGNREGKVVLVREPQELTKMKPGRILVTRMTTPNLLPSIRLAAAIVTDEGGITCHAAILARELRIPCIVGTKYATKFLLDEDVVAIDGKTGIIKKLM